MIENEKGDFPFPCSTPSMKSNKCKAAPGFCDECEPSNKYNYVVNAHNTLHRLWKKLEKRKEDFGAVDFFKIKGILEEEETYLFDYYMKGGKNLLE